MRNVTKLVVLLAILSMFLSCEEDVDYGADLINTYIVESVEYSGQRLDMSILPIEEAMFIEITDDDAITYQNGESVCEDTYDTEEDGIDGVTETAILFTDGSELEYSFVGDKLHLDDDGDIIVLAEYSDQVPPSMWTDPTLTENDTYEPNNTMPMATNIAAGGSIQNHYMGACGDLDYFVFSALAGTSYYLSTTTPAGSELDLTMSLVTGAGDELIYIDDYAMSDYNPGIDWTCDNSGDYYFVIDQSWEGQVGNYSVSVVEGQGLLKPLATPEGKKPRAEKSYRLIDRFFN